MSIDYELIKNNVLERGFHELYEPDGVDLIDPDQFKLLNTEERARDNGVKDVPPELAARLSMCAQALKQKYIDPIWPDAVHHKFLIWEGIDSDSTGWHTDMFEGYDVFFLYYLDDTYPETGGAIQFKWKENGVAKEASVQPKRGTLVLVNNCRGFWHRAIPTSARRRLASFDFTVGLDDD